MLFKVIDQGKLHDVIFPNVTSSDLIFGLAGPAHPPVSVVNHVSDYVVVEHSFSGVNFLRSLPLVSESCLQVLVFLLYLDIKGVFVPAIEWRHDVNVKYEI